MDQFIYWLDNSNLFAPGAIWPWVILTAMVAIGALSGIVSIARRYGEAHDIAGH